jgi:hypothetical protein
MKPSRPDKKLEAYAPIVQSLVYRQDGNARRNGWAYENGRAWSGKMRPVRWYGFDPWRHNAAGRIYPDHPPAFTYIRSCTLVNRPEAFSLSTRQPSLTSAPAHW